MELTPITREEQFLARIAGGNGEVLNPITRTEHFLQRIIDAGGGGGGGGSETDQNAVHYSAETKTDAERAAALANVGGEPIAMYVDIDDTTHAASQTFATIAAAIAEKKRVVFRVAASLAVIELPVVAKGGSSYIVAAATAYIDGPVAMCYVLMADESAVLYTLPLSEAPTTVTDTTSTSATLAVVANTKYKFTQPLTALTISSIPAGEFCIKFVSGSTPTVLTVPNGMHMPDDFTVEANTRYEINCDEDGDALVAGWAVS